MTERLDELSPRCITFDQFGFAIFEFEDVHKTDIDRRLHIYEETPCTCDELGVWSELFETWDNSNSCWSAMFEESIQHGVPALLRPGLWKKLLDTETRKHSSIYDYQLKLSEVRAELVELGISEYSTENGASHLSQQHTTTKPDGIGSTTLRHIMLDLERTFPTHRLFMGRSSEATEGRAALFRVLASYARYNKHVGYCQGMSCIAGMLLMQMSEEDAFWCLVGLLEQPKYFLGYFDNNMTRLKTDADVFNNLLHLRQPQLYQRLGSLGLHPLMYITQWFMCLYTSLPCWDTVLAVWDLMLFQGFRCIYRVALAITELSVVEITQAADISQVLPLLLHPAIDKTLYNILMPVVWCNPVEDWEVRNQLSMLERTEYQSIACNSSIAEAPPSILQRFVNIFKPSSSTALAAGSSSRTALAAGSSSKTALAARTIHFKYRNTRRRSSLRLKQPDNLMLTDKTNMVADRTNMVADRTNMVANRTSLAATDQEMKIHQRSSSKLNETRSKTSIAMIWRNSMCSRDRHAHFQHGRHGMIATPTSNMADTVIQQCSGKYMSS